MTRQLPDGTPSYWNNETALLREKGKVDDIARELRELWGTEGWDTVRELIKAKGPEVQPAEKLLVQTCEEIIVLGELFDLQNGPLCYRLGELKAELAGILHGDVGGALNKLRDTKRLAATRKIPEAARRDRAEKLASAFNEHRRRLSADLSDWAICEIMSREGGHQPRSARRIHDELVEYGHITKE